MTERAGPAAETGEPPHESPVSALPGFKAAQRFFESIIIAVATSTGIYLVGSVYLEAYFGRMSVDASALDFAPPYVALQATHVITNLLSYPIVLTVFYLIYRFLLSRAQWWRTWYEVVHRRLGRLFLLVVNLLIIAPLLYAAIRVGQNLGVLNSTAILSEVSELMQLFVIALLGYVLWLSFGPRRLILTEIRQHKVVPIALLALLYFLDSLIATAESAKRDAELLMSGESDTSTSVSFTLAEGAQAKLPDGELILVALRGSTYYVVERQPFPPSGRPVTYAIPSRVVNQARLQRINATQSEETGFTIFIGEEATPSPR